MKSITIKVNVNGRAWSRVPGFNDAGPNDNVYVVNAKDGSIQFGDGANGRKPEAGSIVSVSYKDGAGSAGNISKRIAKNQSQKFWIIARRNSLAIGWGKRPC